MVVGCTCLTGNRGLLFEVGDAVKDVELTEATPGYRWQIVPSASSPSGFWSKEGRPFRYVADKVGIHIKSLSTNSGKLGHREWCSDISRGSFVTRASNN